MASNNKKDLAPIALELVIAIVEKSKTPFYVDLLQSLGSNMQVVTGAKGTADVRILDMLGLVNHEQNAIFSVVRSDRLEETMDALEDRFHNLKNGKGIAMAVPLSSTIGTMVYGFLTGDERMVKNG
ncbi:MAG: hypothetical protein J6M64_06215 [Oscillospiraceae bacterium]|nr:hypothetical protein [Oscillospiraceae bacterium]